MAKEYAFEHRGDNEVALVAARGKAVLTNPLINKETAFSVEERKALGLTGMLPPFVTTLEEQAKQEYEEMHAKCADNLAKYIYLNELQNRNETLFFKVIDDHLVELFPIVYTPTVGTAIEEYSHWHRRYRGVWLDINHPEDMETALLATGMGPDDVDMLVATDSEGILGIGDQGVDGMLICVGKLSVYTAAAGINPGRVIPVVLDVGTDHAEKRSNPNYLGLQRDRVRGEEYDKFIDQYVETVHRLFPKALIHFEDFGAANAHAVLDRTRDKYPTFNDDIQGTAAVVAAAVLSALETAGGQKMSDQRIVAMGAGTAGIGIADLLVDIMVQEGLSREEGRKRVWGLNSKGLLVEGGHLRDFQAPYARPQREVAVWQLEEAGKIGLRDVVFNVHPTMIIGTSAQPRSFTEEIVRHLAETNERPIIMALSNPTKKSEAIPEDLIKWTDGRALISTGSPFAPVDYQGTSYEIAQGNNALVFPGIGLGFLCCKPTKVSDKMIASSASTVAHLVSDRSAGQPLLPGLAGVREVSKRVAEDFIRAAVDEGLATVGLDEALAAVEANMWEPRYPVIEAV